jgi:hypothetical protein
MASGRYKLTSKMPSGCLSLVVEYSVWFGDMHPKALSTAGEREMSDMAWRQGTASSKGLSSTQWWSLSHQKVRVNLRMSVG